MLREAVTEYFVESNPSYFMSFVADVLERKREIIPAVTHVDGSARYQVLREQDNLSLYKLIRAFERHYGHSDAFEHLVQSRRRAVGGNASRRRELCRQFDGGLPRR